VLLHLHPWPIYDLASLYASTDSLTRHHRQRPDTTRHSLTHDQTRVSLELGHRNTAHLSSACRCVVSASCYFEALSSNVFSFLFLLSQCLVQRVVLSMSCLALPRPSPLRVPMLTKAREYRGDKHHLLRPPTLVPCIRTRQFQPALNFDPLVSSLSDDRIQTFSHSLILSIPRFSPDASDCPRLVWSHLSPFVPKIDLAAV
jgi:hypothetical protein